jgi:Ca-activated chloride channel family protein
MLPFLEGFRFAQPAWLLLLPLAVCLPWLHSYLDHRRRAALATGSAEWYAQLPRTWRQRLLWLPPALRALTLSLLVLALARPQQGFTGEVQETIGLDIIIAVDISGSMRADDFRPNRLVAAQENVREFISKRPGDNFGLIGFGEFAAVLCPLTPDAKVFEDFVNRLRFDLLGSATAMGDAIGLAARQFELSEAESRVLLLMTDGANNAGQLDPVRATEAAATLGVRIYTIGIGSQQASRSFFQQSFVADFDPELLRKIAEMTGGRYFHASDAERFGRIFEEIDRLERTRREFETFQGHAERMAWFLWPAFGCLLLEILLTRTRLRTLP